jgi:antitoxin (DNA-binding transcriptional repressor) of toxin-antitoxin stability system
MRAAGIKLLRAKLGEYVRLAAAGETVLVIDRDQIVAQLGPPPPQQVETLPDALLARAASEGLITPAALPPDAPPPAAPAGAMTLEELLADLEQARADR